MSRILRHSRLMIVAVCCIALGAGISAIASAGAATNTAGHAGRAGHHGGLRRFAARAVHGDLVVATKTGFANVTFDRGVVQSVNGRTLTITEGHQQATHKTVTLTIPAGAKVRDDRQAASLSAVKPGQRVMVITGPKQTFVIARTRQHA